MPSQTPNAPVHAPVEWAQRKDVLYITVRMEDAKCSKMDITDEKISIEAGRLCLKLPTSLTGCLTDFVSLDRSLEFVIPKKESGPFWPRLLKTATKQHWLKVDFNKWKDEDDESDPENAWDMNDMMSKMGGMPGGRSDFDFDDDNESDNAELPDLEDDKEEAEAAKFEDNDKAAEGDTEKEKSSTDGKKAATATS